MSTLTLKNVPEDLHRRLKERAARNRRSVEDEALRCLDEAVAAPPLDDEAFLEEVRLSREALAARGVWITPESIREAIEQGRA